MSGEACERLDPAIARVASGEASSKERRGVSRHVRHCGHCRALLRRRRESNEWLAALVPIALLAGNVMTGTPDPTPAIAWWERVADGATVRMGNAVQMAMDLPSTAIAKVGAGDRGGGRRRRNRPAAAGRGRLAGRSAAGGIAGAAGRPPAGGRSHPRGDRDVGGSLLDRAARGDRRPRADAGRARARSDGRPHDGQTDDHDTIGGRQALLHDPACHPGAGGLTPGGGGDTSRPTLSERRRAGVRAVRRRLRRAGVGALLLGGLVLAPSQAGATDGSLYPYGSSAWARSAQVSATILNGSVWQINAPAMTPAAINHWEMNWVCPVAGSEVAAVLFGALRTAPPSSMALQVTGDRRVLWSEGDVLIPQSPAGGRGYDVRLPGGQCDVHLALAQVEARPQHARVYFIDSPRILVRDVAPPTVVIRGVVGGLAERLDGPGRCRGPRRDNFGEDGIGQQRIVADGQVLWAGAPGQGEHTRVAIGQRSRRRRPSPGGPGRRGRNRRGGHRGGDDLDRPDRALRRPAHGVVDRDARGRATRMAGRGQPQRSRDQPGRDQPRRRRRPLGRVDGDRQRRRTGCPRGDDRLAGGRGRPARMAREDHRRGGQRRDHPRSGERDR